MLGLTTLTHQEADVSLWDYSGPQTSTTLGRKRIPQSYAFYYSSLSF